VVTTGTSIFLGTLVRVAGAELETKVSNGFHARVVEVLSAMTGATGVQLVLWATTGRLAAARTGQRCFANHQSPATASTAARRCPCCDTSTDAREPLIVRDATPRRPLRPRPPLTGLTCCSLLAVPILGRATLRAVLVLENRLMRGAFTGERLGRREAHCRPGSPSHFTTPSCTASLLRVAEQQGRAAAIATLVAREVSATEVFCAVGRRNGFNACIWLTPR